MARYTEPKHRIARRYDAKISIFDRNSYNVKNHKQHPAGQHGAASVRKKLSDFGVQLKEQQKLKALYGMLSQKQLVNNYRKASQKKGATADLLCEALECRLDTICSRLFSFSPFAAQQLVSHGHVQVNGKKVNIRSYNVKVGDVISIKPASRELKFVKERVTRDVPGYLEIAEDKLSGKLVTLPNRADIPWPIIPNVDLACEFLSYKS